MIMDLPFLPFSAPNIGDDEVNEVVSCLRSGWVTTGPKAGQFERDFASFIGSDVQAVAVNSATAGLHLGLEALGIGIGDEVITTTHTFTATAEVIRYLGATPVFVDIKEDTLCMDIDCLPSYITERTKAIIPVHFAGRSCDMTRLLALARRFNLYVLEDAAHALPSTHKAQLIGSLDSDITVFSFYANKTITTGEGGMLVTRNPLLANRARVMRLHGISKDVFDRFSSKKASWFYQVIAPGYKYNMTDLAASIGIHQLRKANAFQLRRQYLASLYDELLIDLPLILPPHPAVGDNHSWHLYVVRLDHSVSISRDDVIERMFALGVGCSVHYIPLHLHPYWRDTYHLTPSMFPVSQSVYEQSISLPIYPGMLDADCQRVASALTESLV